MQVPLTKHGVKDGARLVLLKSRAPPAVATQPDIASLPTLEDVERVIRAEAELQGRDVAQASAAPPRPREVPMEARLHDIMQACSYTFVECSFLFALYRFATECVLCLKVCR